MQVRQRQEAHQVLSANVVASIARTIIEADETCRHILKKNGVPFTTGESWCQGILHDLGYSKRRCTSACSKLPEDWQTQGLKLTYQVPYASALRMCLLFAFITD